MRSRASGWVMSLLRSLGKSPRYIGSKTVSEILAGTKVSWWLRFGDNPSGEPIGEREGINPSPTMKTVGAGFTPARVILVFIRG